MASWTPHTKKDIYRSRIKKTSTPGFRARRENARDALENSLPRRQRI